MVKEIKQNIKLYLELIASKADFSKINIGGKYPTLASINQPGVFQGQKQRLRESFYRVATQKRQQDRAGLGSPLLIPPAMKKTYDDIRKSMGLFGKESKKVADKLKGTAKAFETTDKSAKKLDKNLKQSKKTVEGFTNKIVAMGGKLRSISRLFFYASLDMRTFANVLLGPMVDGIRLFADFNKNLTMISVNAKALGQYSEESFANLEEQITKVSTATEFSRLELVKAAAVFGTAGTAVDSISSNLTEMARLARVNFTDLNAIARETLRTMKRFDMSIEEASHEMWRLTAISQQTGESIMMISTHMGYAVEMGQELGWTYGEILGAMVLLTETYGTSSIAGRRLATVFSVLIGKGEEYGIQMRNMNGDIISSQQQIENLTDYLDLIGDPMSQNQYLMELFGKTGADSARKLVDAFKSGKLGEIVEDQGDVMIDTMKELSDTISGELYVSIQDLNSELENTRLALGESLAGAIREVLTPLRDALVGIQKFIIANEELITSLGAVALAFAGLSVVIQSAGFLIEIIVALSTAAAALGAALTLLKPLLMGVGMYASLAAGGGMAGMVVGFAAMAAVVALVIALIILIVGAIYGFIKTIVEASKKIESLAKGIRVLQLIIGVLVKLLQVAIAVVILIGVAIFKIGEIIGSFIALIVILIVHVLELANVLNVVTAALEWFEGVLGAITGGISDLLGGLLPHSPSLADRFVELGESIRGTLSPMQQAVMWGRRLNQSVGKMNASANFGVTGSLAEGGVGGAGRGGTTIYVDGAYIRDPEELANVIADRQIRVSRRSYRSTAY